jgi:hypothetical protein
MKNMRVHPLCQMFSRKEFAMPADQRAQLMEDIRENGIKVPILVNEQRNTILDGLTRWKIAHDLKLSDSKIPLEVFEGSDDEIEAEILSRNYFRRHITPDQRVAIITKLRRPALEAEAKARERAGKAPSGQTQITDDSRPSGQNIITKQTGETADKIAAEAGVSQRKARQAIKADQAGELEDVIAGKTKLRDAAKRAPSKRKRKEVPWEDQVFKKWTQWLNRFAPPQRGRVKELVTGWATPDVKGAKR